MIPESRKDEGLIFGRSSIENTTLPQLHSLSCLGVVRRRAERKAARSVLGRSGVHGASYGAPVETLSGGNQQKVLLARMLLCEPRVVIADEPTRGVDIGAKRAIYDFLVELAGAGMGILLISSEVEEISALPTACSSCAGAAWSAELEATGSPRTASSPRRSPTSLRKPLRDVRRLADAALDDARADALDGRALPPPRRHHHSVPRALPHALAGQRPFATKATSSRSSTSSRRP